MLFDVFFNDERTTDIISTTFFLYVNEQKGLR